MNFPCMKLNNQWKTTKCTTGQQWQKIFKVIVKFLLTFNRDVYTKYIVYTFLELSYEIFLSMNAFVTSWKMYAMFFQGRIYILTIRPWFFFLSLMLKTNMLKWNHVAILKQRVHSWCWNNFMFIDTGYVYHGKHTFRVRGVFCPEDPAPLKGGYAVYKLLNMPF